MADIGQTLFVELLGMTQYPGQPFTGNIYRDIIMFLIVPTIFIIMVLYIMSGRVIPDKKFRVMLGVGAYLFIIAGGYYSFFALLAGPYFIFLIFILGVLGYFAGHFRRGGGGYSGGGGGGYSEGGDKKLRTLIGVPKTLSLSERKYLKDKLRDVETRIKSTEKSIEICEQGGGRGDIGRLNDTLDKLIAERQRIQDRLD